MKIDPEAETVDVAPEKVHHRNRPTNICVWGLEKIGLDRAGLIEGETEDFVNLGLSQLARILAQATAETQPTKEVLEAFLALLKIHREGTPAADFETKVAELSERIDELRDALGISQIYGRQARR